MRSLVNPRVAVVVVVHDFGVGEPELDFVVCGLNGIGTVANVTANINAEVSADSAGLRVEGAGGAEHLSAGSDGVVAFPNHAANGAGVHVFNEAREELLASEVSVVLLEVLLAGLAELHASELEALLLEALDDLANKTALNAVGLDHDEGSLLGGVDH